MTLLTIITNVVDELLLSAPMTAIGNTDRQVAQLIALANREGKYLTRRLNLQELTKEATFVTVATESQGTIITHAAGFQRFVPETFWNRTDQIELFGPVDPNEWQAMQARGVTPSTPHYMVREGILQIYPAPVASLTFAFEYYTKNWVTLASSGEADEFAADGDTTKIDQDIIELGVLWRWNKLMGLDYSEEFRAYEIALKNYALSNKSRRRVVNQGRPLPRRGDYTAVAAP